MARLIKAAGSLVIILLIGYALAGLIFQARPIRNKAWAFAPALGLGLGVLAEFGLVSLLLTGSIEFRVVYAAAALGAIAILFRMGGAGLSSLLAFFRRRPIPRGDGGPERPATQRIIAYSGKIVVAVVALVVAFNLLARPMYQFDARAIWGLKAKILYQEKTIFSEGVEDISRNHPHPRYPLLIPIASAWVFNNIGEADDRAARILFLLFFAGLVAATYQLAQRLAGKASGLVAVSAMVIAPCVYRGMSGGASSGYADLPLSFFIVLATMAMMVWMKEKDVIFAIAAALFAGFAALTKNEGMVFALNLFIAAAIFSLGREGEEIPDGAARRLSAEWLKTRRPQVLGLTVYALALFAALLPWLFVRAGLPRFLDEDYARHMNWRDVSGGLARLPVIVRYFGAEMLNARNWGLIWILAPASACIALINGKRESRFISVLIALQALSYAAVFVITPNDFVGQMRVSLTRLLLHVLPLGAVLISLQACETAPAMSPLRQSYPPE